jgi:hypothetical protein
LTYTRATQFPACDVVERTYEPIIERRRHILGHARLDVFADDQRAACSCAEMRGSN